MRLIGVCGRSGSGKGVFCDEARKRNIKVIDCDALYHKMVSKPSQCLDDIAHEFGDKFIKNHALDRKSLAEEVFSDKEKLKRLNRITHMHITDEIFRIIYESQNESYIILDAPTLFESGLNKYCDIIVGIIANDEICIERILKRDSITYEMAQKRLESQKSLDFIVENSDALIYNDGDIDDFLIAVNDFFEKLTEECID